VRAPLHAEQGQATVELAALLPVVVAVAVAVHSVLAAGRAREQAGAAAHGAAVALLQERDPRAAARAAVPEGARDRLALDIDGRRVQARMKPGLPLFGDLLTATARADAGPQR
jgi:hypothetical protein